MLDRYLAALPAMSLIPFAPFFTADFFALLFERPAAPSPGKRKGEKGSVLTIDTETTEVSD
jgi:hypothetical protein